MPPPSIPIPGNNLDLSVPPVYQRPLGADEGARVFVKKFVITGVIGDRSAGINPADIQHQVDERFAHLEKLLEEQRLKKEGLAEQGPEGFTSDEKEKIIKFMQGAVKTASPEEQQKQYQQFIQQLQLERLQRLQGLTIGQLQQVADVVTKYYHDRGYFLARAIVPAQEVKDGVVHIRVLEGRLAHVVVSGNKRYSQPVLERPFKPLIGDLVTVERTENALLTLTKYPGLSAAGVFKPGPDVGTTDIVINVNREKPYDVTARADNEGTAFTGEKRLIGTFNWNNPTGGADLLGVTALKTFSPSNSTFGDVRYAHPFFSASNTWALDLSRNSFDVSGSSFAPGSIGGVSKIATLSFQRAFLRSRERNIIGTMDLSRKRADTQFFGRVIGRDDLAVLGAQLNYDSIDSKAGTISTSYVRLERGLAGVMGVPSDDEILNKQVSPLPSRTGSDNKPALPDFTRLTVNYQLYKNLPSNQGLLFRFNGQYSPDLLSSLEQYVIGGSDNVRALPTSQFLVDTAAFASLEYSVRAPGFASKAAFGGYTWGQMLRFRVFIDAAVGLLNKPVNVATKRETAAGSGLGIEFTYPGLMTANLQWARLNGGARPGTSASDPTAVKDASQVWLDVSFSF
ncbi:MAG TPA: ShlB/FhaC/HecB family hemolysin secretion/activation protein [Gammaproteobacteria bacterium]|nr:ShlB/FhaC/HecB family hemolysin secretion/activation protein [Gammaproteobacteria bacterium]